MKDIALNTTMSVDLNEVNGFIESDKFANFLLSNTTDFTVALFILQTLKDKINELKGE